MVGQAIAWRAMGITLVRSRSGISLSMSLREHLGAVCSLYIAVYSALVPMGPRSVANPI